VTNVRLEIECITPVADRVEEGLRWRSERVRTVGAGVITLSHGSGLG